jgi:O-methyltransferase involved in polyketide biosynthesis
MSADRSDDTNTGPWPRRPYDTDPDTPSVSRVYDAYQGGGATNKADRRFAQRAQEILPEIQGLAAINRRFLTRAVRYCVEAGVTQFVDIGAGLPSAWALHQEAQRHDPTATFVYLDNEAVSVEALRAKYSGHPRTHVALGDVRDVDDVLATLEASGLITLSKPVALIMGLVLHFIPDEENPAGFLARYREAMAPGSFLIVSHDTADGREDDMRKFAELYHETNRPLILRNRTELATLLAGFDLVPPGIVHMPSWRPEPDDEVEQPERSCVYAVVAGT